MVFPGILEGAIKMLDKSKQYVLSIDGKKIAPGLSKPLFGDINLWAHKKPNLEGALKKRNEELEFIAKIDKEINEIDGNSEIQPKIKMLPALLSKMSEYISWIRNTEIGHRTLLKKLEKLAINNPDKKKDYTFGMESVKALVLTTVDWIQRALFTNKELCSVLSCFNNNETLFARHDVISMNQQRNIRQLIPVEKMPPQVDVNNNEHFVKQRSTLWHEIQKRCVVSASSAFNALGLRSLKEQKIHHTTYVQKKEGPKKDANLKEKLLYGTENEVRI